MHNATALRERLARTERERGAAARQLAEANQRIADLERQLARALAPPTNAAGVLPTSDHQAVRLIQP